jgi:NitT/TauT family transport system permease protein
MRFTRRFDFSTLAGWLLFAALIGIWELVARLHLVSPMLFPSMSAIFASFVRLIASGEIPGHLLISLQNMFSGIVIAAVLAIPLGLAIGFSSRLHNLLIPTIEAIRPLPDTALIPLAMAVLGAGAGSKIALVAFGCARILIIAAMYGARSVDAQLVETAKSYGYRNFGLFRRVILPAAAPHIMTGIRYSIIVALLLEISAEILGSFAGIGFLTMLMMRGFNTAEMYACVLALCVVGYFLSRVINITEHVVMPWYGGYKSASR